MSKDFRNELEQMERLMNYGMNESKKSTDSKAIVEYSQLAADGKTYGVLREGTKYYVKVAPKKNTQVLAEDYDYVGGYMNRKAYDSYSKASNALNLQLISVNEANNSKKTVSQYNLNESAEWQTNMTKEARKELNRFYQLNGEVDKLLSENIHYISEDKNAPFTDNGKANYNGKNGGGNNGKQGSPNQNLGLKSSDATFVDGENSSRPNKMQKLYQDGKGEFGKKSGFGDHNIGEEGGNAYQSKPTKMNEGRRSVKLSEEQERQIAAWRRGFVHNDEEGLVDRSHGTEIGDKSPWTNNVNEEFGKDEWDDGLPGEAGTGDAKKYREPFTNQNGVRQPVSEQYIFEVEMDGGDDIEDPMAEIPDTEEGDDLENEDFDYNANNYSVMDDTDDSDPDLVPSNMRPSLDSREQREIGSGFNVDTHFDPMDHRQSMLGQVGWDSIDDEDEEEGSEDNPIEINYNPMDDDENEEIDENKQYVFEVTLNDFGKHPAYRKKPMTLPQNGDGSQWGEDWNDESTKGELPYGRQIGHSGDPFTDKVENITNAVVTALGKKKE